MSVVTDMKQLQRVMSLEAPPKDGKARDGSEGADAAAESGSEGGPRTVLCDAHYMRVAAWCCSTQHIKSMR